MYQIDSIYSYLSDSHKTRRLDPVKQEKILPLAALIAIVLAGIVILLAVTAVVSCVGKKRRNFLEFQFQFYFCDQCASDERFFGGVNV